MSAEEEDVDVSSEATSDNTVIDPSGDFSPHDDEEFNPFSELSEEYKPSVIKKVIATDGMPTNSVQDAGSDIPPLSPETLICMEDTSSFVLRCSRGKISDSFSKEEVEQFPDGKYYLKNKDLEVYPIRPRCKNYVRQMAMFEMNPDGKLHLRLCSARRTTEGTFMTVRDSAMWACTMREPRDLVTEQKHLDAFDIKKVEQGKNRENFSIFQESKK